MLQYVCTVSYTHLPIDAGDGEGDFVSTVDVGELKEGVLGDSE